MVRICAAVLAAGVIAAGCSAGADAGNPLARTLRAGTTSAPTGRSGVHSTAGSSPASASAPVAHVSASSRSGYRRHSRRRVGVPLPLPYRTGPARQVVTVVASSATTTRATLQRWRRVWRGWRRVGPAVPAWLGYAGFSRPASEQRTATPTGSFTLTRAFGALPDPGTRLPYRRTTPADWWISQPGPLYNTLQHCASSCPFTQGAPNEHLRYELPYYDYAVVIDYNTANAPGGVRPGWGSAFFLHVTVHQPTQGCVSVPRAALVRVLQWLRPSRHPRIVLGVRRG